MRLHPSVIILTSAYPVISIWEANQAQWVAPFSPRGKESALVVRPFLAGETRRLAAGTDAFLAALGSGVAIGEAVEAGAAAASAISPAEALATLIGANIAVGIEA